MNLGIVTSTFPADKRDVIKAPFLGPLISHLQGAGHRVFVLTQETGAPTEEVFRGVEVHRFEWRRVEGSLAEMSLRSPRNVLATLSLVASGIVAARRLAVSRQIDLFLGLWALPAGLYLYPLSVLGSLRAPYFIWALGSDVNKYKTSAVGRFVLRRIFRGASAVFSVGFDLVRDVERIAGTRCEFLSAFRKLPAGADVSRAANAVPNFAFVGRHTLVKGVDVLLDAVKILSERGVKRFRVRFASEGELTAALERRVEAEGLRPLVEFVGRLSDEGLRDFFASCDCVVIPSRAEGFPLVFGEALQMNRPLIVSDVAGMGTLGTQNGVARAVPKEDAVALADAMAEFLKRPFAPDAAGRRTLLDLLAFDRSVQTLLARIESCASGEKGATAARAGQR